MKAEDKFDFDIFPTPDKTSFQGSIYSQGFRSLMPIAYMGHRL